MLEVQGLSAGYQGNEVVHRINLRVGTGEAVMVIGSNGAGKTTLFRSICGLISPLAGEVRLDDERIDRFPAHGISRMGIGFVAAERHLFGHMTVAENLALGAYPTRGDPETLAMVLDLFPRLAERRRQNAATMSGGEQQMLAVGRALMAKPKLLLLDEPTTGLAPKLAMEAYRALTKLRQQGLTLLVAEQQVPLALALCDRGYVLENGHIGLEGTSAALRANPEVKRAYLGVA